MLMGMVWSHPTRWAIGVGIFALVVGVGQVWPRPAAPRALTALRTVDLSHVVHERVPYLGGEPPTQLLRDGAGQLTQLTLGTHTGSFLRVMVAPGAERTTVENLSPHDLVLPAIVIDARDQVQDQPTFALSVADVLAWERTHGLIPPGALVLLTTGWDMRWGDATAYLHAGADGLPQVPGFAPAAADLLLNQRKVTGLGVDAPAMAYTPATGLALWLANLTNLEQLPPTGATIVIGALKLQAAASSPARVLALVP
ncbi:MAG: cyclase family protein [Chloroflexales bacterium]